MKREEYVVIRDESLEFLKKAKIILTKEEIDNFEVADFGLGRIRELGLQLIVYINNDKYCAKELVLLPKQTCPQHTHPPVNESPGKEETFRCRYGTVYLYIPGPSTDNPIALVPADKEEYFTVWNEIILKPGEQYTIPPNTPHWFQSGEEGAVVSEFSSKSTDENDIFIDPEIIRAPSVD